YRSMRFNQYTFSGLQFFGAGVELDPKGFRFAAFYGRFTRPVTQDTLASITPIPTYLRTGYGVKIGVGSHKNFFDVMLFRAADDTSSISQPIGDPRIAPKENVALGISTRFMLTKRISWTTEAGASVMNEDIRYPAVTDQDISINEPLLFTTRLGTRALFAGNTALNYTDRIFGLRVQFRQVDPDYRSLGTFYQQTDLRSITVEPTVRFWKNKVRVGGSIGRQHDNLYGRKSTTSVRDIGSANITVNATRSYSIDLRFTNYGIAQEAGLQVLSDTFRLAQVNRTYMVSQRYTKTGKVRTIALSLTGGMQNLADLNPYGTYASAENEVIYGNFYASHIRMRDNLALNAGLNYSLNSTIMGNHELMGPSLGFTVPLAKQKITLSINGTYNIARQNGDKAGYTQNLSSMLQYRVSKSHRLQLSTSVLQNNTTILVARNFTEIRFVGGYVFVFSTKS
ncbi:MAG: hypothetical protein M3R08_10855, partial [Bacteroidota bacterium]|nr:hypothetical protein [Bacteroidota bacterium]